MGSDYYAYGTRNSVLPSPTVRERELAKFDENRPAPMVGSLIIFLTHQGHVQQQKAQMQYSAAYSV